MTHEHGQWRYLAAKASVDDRARSRRVRDCLRDALPEDPEVVEAGCGLGGTVPHLYDWGVAPSAYRGVDTAERVVALTRRLTPCVLRRHGLEAEDTPAGCRVDGARIAFETGDALDALPGAGADLLVAQSFLDLVDLDAALDAIDAALAPGGLAYAPLTFDGVTLFQPDHPADDRVLDAYHDAIDSEPGRDSRAGRHLLDLLRGREDATLLAAAASDWLVRPIGGAYRADERYFLDRILDFVADAARGVDGGEDWLATRRRQLAAGELTYVAHGYDLLWRREDRRA
jgi:SAM-dependent methyltransferase